MIHISEKTLPVWHYNKLKQNRNESEMETDGTFKVFMYFWMLSQSVLARADYNSRYLDIIYIYLLYRTAKAYFAKLNSSTCDECEKVVECISAVTSDFYDTFFIPLCYI